MTSYPCVYCQARLLKSFFKTTSQFGDDFDIRFCDQCKTYSLCPHPNQEQLQKAYAEDYYGVGNKKFQPWIERLIDGFRNRRAHKIIKYLPKGGTILDVGCGNGGFLAPLIEKGFKCHGVEPPGGSAERAKQVKGLELKIGYLSEDDFEKDSLDLITLWHVYEHLPNPRQIAEIFSHVIKPGGYLVMSLPNIESWQATWFKGRWFHLDPPRHLFFQSGEVIANHLRQFGFELEAKTTLSLEQNVFGFQQSLLNLWFSEREILYELMKGNPEIIKRYSTLSRALQRGFFWVSAPFCLALSLLESAFGFGGTMELVFKKVGVF